MKDETVWSMERFNDYINTEIAEQHGLPDDWVFGHFTVSFLNYCLSSFISFSIRGGGEEGDGDGSKGHEYSPWSFLSLSINSFGVGF